MNRTAERSPGRAERLGGGSVSLLDAEPAFAAGVPAEERQAAEQMLRSPVIALGGGPWEPPGGIDRALALLVLDGIVLRDRQISAGSHLILAGPTDLVDVRHLASGGESWRVVRPGSVAVIDARVLVAARRWPGLMRVLAELLFDAVDEQAELKHILGLARVESRVLAFFSHYADRWGFVTPGGRAIDLPLTHEVLGRLVGAKRPTVTLALKGLLGEGRLVRDERGRWVLPHEMDNAV